MRSTRITNWGCLVPLVVIGLWVFGIPVLRKIVPSDAQRALPEAARNVQTYSAGFHDQVYLLRADFPREGYAAYARSLGFTQRFDPASHGGIESVLNTSVGDAPAWWDPPRASDTTFFEHVKDDDHLRFLKYGDGKVYFLTLSW